MIIINRLPDTVAKFKSHAKNYLSSFEEGKRLLPETLSKADELLSSRDVQRIQSLLLNRSRKTSNWLAFWWNTEAYDKPRLPIVLHVNCNNFQKKIISSIVFY